MIDMGKRIKRLFIIKTPIEAWLVCYAIALGGVERGRHYLELYPGGFGIALFLCCASVVLLAGPKVLDAVRAGL